MLARIKLLASLEDSTPSFESYTSSVASRQLLLEEKPTNPRAKTFINLAQPAIYVEFRAAV
ncbi:MAG: hypothetical protein IJP17_01530 [Clostridia bacterium]|nr:hypothetical protein [Clostridia bacterium]